ncbi:2-dehydropantoate 2-reductase [Tolypocladium paradoxum]|uniref:2-dehydropantoate 2-reductase n=1 Tax=Tolypocladium paradoxum TaxID=94208 RepID=A0A2S4KM22_9HYPO|nr:2-dehydropantoate 2-reductase [Tolypocladium paradoxum]
MATNNQIDVLVYGLGAIGSFYAFILSRSPRVRLSVIARSNYEPVKAHGIVMNSENHGQHVVRPFRGKSRQSRLPEESLRLEHMVSPIAVFRSAAEANMKFDYIICTHKAIAQDAVPAQLAPVADEETTTFVIIQNGVGNEDPFRARFPKTTIISCVTWTGGVQPEPGRFAQIKSEDMQVGLFPNEAADHLVEKRRLDEFASLLTQGKTVFQVVPNIQVQRWEKVVWNAAWNSLTTLTLLDTHSWLDSSADATPLTRRLMKEVIDVAKKCNVPIEYELIDRLIAKIRALPPIGSSMQNDYKAGKPMEVDIILGTPFKKGREMGVPTPTLETIYLILAGVNLRLMKESQL